MKDLPVTLPSFGWGTWGAGKLMTDSRTRTCPMIHLLSYLTPSTLSGTGVAGAQWAQQGDS